MSEAITPKALAEEIGIDAKVLRAYLRKEWTRPNEVKNTSWIITTEAADAAREKFAKQETPSTDEA
jgi:predicted site-specific integrase-resolvase